MASPRADLSFVLDCCMPASSRTRPGRGYCDARRPFCQLGAVCTQLRQVRPDVTERRGWRIMLAPVQVRDLQKRPVGES
jgi:hypothetical protein